ncbi:MAG: agarase [Lentisphaerae bacterium]|nr:agarase [Lentisphaerota bacterium]
MAVRPGPVRAAAPGRFFSVGRKNGRWWFVTPEGKPFFSIALNHIDPAPLRTTANGDLWERKYGNSMERWLREAVAPDLLAWGFNSVGWTQEVVTRGLTNHRHSRAFTFEEYQWLGLPYCHQLPFADFHQWEVETRHPDFGSAEFADWCDYVAREHCARMAGDPKLIGYFYIDCPTWIHTRPHNEWKGPLFDPGKLKTDAGRRELTALATQWYRVTHDAIRRYDKHHLILGDRYEAGQPMAEEVVRAALPYVDVLSFQHFKQPDEVAANLRQWHDLTGKPVLLADQCVSIRGPDGVQRHDGAGYAATLAALRGLPGCVGYHLCGAYLRNTARNRALRAADETPDTAAIDAITAANRDAAAWMKTQE